MHTVRARRWRDSGCAGRPGGRPVDPTAGSRRIVRHPAIDNHHRRRRGGRRLPERQADIPPARPADPAGRVRIHCLDLEPARSVSAAPDRAAPKRRSGDRYRFGPAGIRRPGGGMRLSSGHRDHPPGEPAARIRGERRARKRLDRAPAAQVPRPGVGAAQCARARRYGHRRSANRHWRRERVRCRLRSGSRRSSYSRRSSCSRARSCEPGYWPGCGPSGQRAATAWRPRSAGPSRATWWATCSPRPSPGPWYS